MKNLILIIFSFIQLNCFSQSFVDLFSEGSLRIDYIHTANSKNEVISLDNFYHEPNWGGSEINLVDTFNYGLYKFEVIDSASSKIIYSRGFSSLCAEWQFTEEAKHNWRSFSESLIIPFPKQTIKVIFYRRNTDQEWGKISEMLINPKNNDIIPGLKTPLTWEKIYDSGEPKTKLDIVFLAEGYTKDELSKFRSDAFRFKDYLLNCSPFKEYAKNINIWIVNSESLESGTDDPLKNEFKNTCFDSHFNTFGTDRYLNTTNNISVRNAAANVPYDQIYILVNTKKYGGAGIYNFYSICSADNKNSDFVFTHEFGHAFAGLADEYYTSDVAVEDFYNLKKEPWEPNITTLVDFQKKWKNTLEKQTSIPTKFDSKNPETLGAFEGAGYSAKGIYRPRYDCSMKSIKYNYFCPVCSKAIIDMIMFYSK